MQMWRCSSSTPSVSSGERTVGPQADSVILDDSREEDKLRLAAEDKPSHWVLVRRLDTHISQTMFADMFYQFGAVESFVSWDSGEYCKKGFVRFPGAELAALAVSKMNDFIPCRQSQPITVEHVTATSVMDAKMPLSGAEETPSDHPTSVVHLAGLQSSSPQNVAHRIQFLGDPVGAAREICSAVGKSSSQRLKKLADSCAAVLPSWPHRTHFQCELSRGLFYLLVGSDGEAGEAKGAGLFLAYLFRSAFLPGHPMSVAAKLLRAVRRPADLDGVCIFVDELFAFDDASSMAFWAGVGEIAADHPSAAVQAASIAKLRHRLRRMSMDLPPRPLGVSAARQRAEESRSRTVHFSHLNPALPNALLMQFLRESGVVMKVRRCVDGSHANHFGFVEMSTTAEAQLLISRDRARISGCEIRLQPARSAVLDVDPSDAVCVSDTTTPCTFGR